MILSEFNFIAIVILLMVVIYYVSGFNNLVKGLYRTSTGQYLNTTARIKALDYAPDAIITIDENGHIVSWNTGAYSIFGWKENDVIGKNLEFIMPEKYREMHRVQIERLKEIKNPIISSQPRFMQGLNKKGEEFPIKLILWRWIEGASVFYTGIIRNITEQRKKENETATIIRMFERAEEIDKSGSWSWDVLKDEVYVSSGFRRIFDIDKELISSTYLLKRVYFEDLRRVEEAIKVAFEKKEGYTLRYRVVASNGNLMQVEIRAETFLNMRNELINITGTIHIV